jgi:hypothetical protein
MAWDRERWLHLVDTANGPSDSIKGVEFIDRPNYSRTLLYVVGRLSGKLDNRSNIMITHLISSTVLFSSFRPRITDE